MSCAIKKTACRGVAVLLVEFELGVYNVFDMCESGFLFGERGAEVGNVSFMGMEDRVSFYGGGQLDEEGGIFRRRLDDC